MRLYDQMSSPVARYLAGFRRYYPGILEWYSGLVDGLATGSRKMFVSWNQTGVQGLAIAKNGYRAKLCHISVSPAARGQGLGRTLMSAAMRDMVNSGAREIRVTTGEEVFRDHAAFFQSVGFEVIDWHAHRYRRGDSELLWKLDVCTSQRVSSAAPITLGQPAAGSAAYMPLPKLRPPQSGRWATPFSKAAK